jgi:hypothetical protein
MVAPFREEVRRDEEEKNVMLGCRSKQIVRLTGGWWLDG